MAYSYAASSLIVPLSDIWNRDRELKTAVFRSIVKEEELSSLLLDMNLRAPLLKGNKFLSYGEDGYVYGLPSVEVTKMESCTYWENRDTGGNYSSSPQQVYGTCNVWQEEKLLDFKFHPMAMIRQNKSNVFNNYKTVKTWVGYTQEEVDEINSYTGVNGVTTADGHYVETREKKEKQEYSKEQWRVIHSTEKLLDTINMDLGDITETINTNESIGDIDDVFVSFVVPVAGKEPAQIQYLYHFFDEINKVYDIDKIHEITEMKWEEEITYGDKIDPACEGVDAIPPNPSIPGDPGTPAVVCEREILEVKEIIPPPLRRKPIKFKIRQKDFFIEIGFSAIEVTYESGKLTENKVVRSTKKTGEIDPDTGVEETEEVVEVIEINEGRVGNYQRGDRTYTSSTEVTNPQTREKTLVTSTKYLGVQFKKQTSPGVIRVITVYNLTHYTFITTDDILDTLKYTTAVTEKEFYIPLSKKVMDSMGSIDEGELYNTSMSLVINTLNKTKLKWYQSTWFKFVLIVIAVVITAFTGQSWLIAAAAAITAGIVAVVVLILQTILIAILVRLAMTVIVKILGEKFALIIAVVAIIAAAVSGDLVLLTNVFTLASSIASVVTENVAKDLEKLNEDREEFQDAVDERKQEIQEAEELMGTPGGLMAMLQEGRGDPVFYANETPDTFISRSLINNPGVMTIEIQSNYFEVALELPTFTGRPITPGFI